MCEGVFGWIFSIGVVDTFKDKPDGDIEPKLAKKIATGEASQAITSFHFFDYFTSLNISLL